MYLLKAVLSILFAGCFVTSTVQSRTTASLEVVNSYPSNGTRYVHPFSNIGVNFSKALDPNRLPIDSFSVFGSNNKQYSGSLKLSRNRKTLIFTPTEHFLLGDSIYVRIGSFFASDEEITKPSFLRFSIQNKLAIPNADYHQDDLFTEPSHTDMPLASPLLTVVASNNPYDGQIFLTGIDSTGSGFLSGYLGIFDNNANTVKLLKNKKAGAFVDFKPNPNNTYSYIDYADPNHPTYFILDTNFSIIDSVITPSQYAADGHELRFTSEDNRLIIADENITVDMRQFLSNGDSAATVVVPSVLVFDKDNNLIWVWRSIDHFSISDATHESFLARNIDFCHINAIEFDADSNLIFTCRNMDEDTKVDRITGNIIWRWGGKNNQFTLIGDTIPFSHQHATRLTPQGTYTMFDDGNFRPGLMMQYSRAVEYRLDTMHHTATKIWEFRHSPDIVSGNAGYVQRLPNGNTLIGWGAAMANELTAVSEVDSKNNTRLEMAWTRPGGSYRAYKYDTNYIHGITSPAFVSSTPLASAQITVTPNPMTDGAKFRCTVTIEGSAQISLYDALGREISKIYSGYLSQGEHEFTIDTKKIAGGAYFIHANFSGSSVSSQIVVLK